MLLLPDGSIRGTIGRGCGEAVVRSEARMLFDCVAVCEGGQQLQPSANPPLAVTYELPCRRHGHGIDLSQLKLCW
jgi:xanthine/CO dehydrogenase XdhC/CoxF family maturation factor